MRFKDEKDIPSGGGDKFVKLKDGESIAGVFMGDPYEFSVLWSSGKSSVVEDGTPNAKFRFRVNFITKDAKGYVAKLFEQGPAVYKRLIKLNEDFQGLENVVVKITRHGSGMNDTEYTIDPVMDPKNPRQLMAVPDALSTVQLLPMTQETKPKDAPDHDFGPPPIDSWTPDEIPF